MTTAGISQVETESTAAAPLLEAKGLTRHFRVGRGFSRQLLHAVDDVNFSIGRQEIVALAGESGSGKSTIARLLAGVYRPTGGEIFYQGRAMSTYRSRKDQLSYRGDVPMVFQDPFSSLNPAFRVSHGVLRSLKLHRPSFSRAQRFEEAERVIEAVGLSPAGDIMQRYPYELSGGQRQRIGFAQALAHKPKLILADEPVSMLDVSIRTELLRLMLDLRAARGLTYLFITHDLSLAWVIADRIAVMYLGRIMEIGPAEQVIRNPQNPYTRALVSVSPTPATGRG